MADERADQRLERWVNFGASIVAPATALSALLFYFGYISARAQYEYFGVDVDTIGLSTRDYVQRSPQPLLVPLLALTLIGIGAVLGHTVIRRRISDLLADDSRTGERRFRLRCRLARGAGVILLAAGVLLLLLYTFVTVLQNWALYNLVTPLLIATGAAIAWYADRVVQLLTPAAARPTPSETSVLVLRRSTAILIGVVIAASLFWATATVAQWTGVYAAKSQAQRLDRLPTVILDTKERLYSTAGCRHDLRVAASADPCILERALPLAPGQTFRYRYRNLRLLIQGRDRMFLVPDVWSASDSTLVVPLDGSVRVRFQFVNDPP